MHIYIYNIMHTTRVQYIRSYRQPYVNTAKSKKLKCMTRELVCHTQLIVCIGILSYAYDTLVVSMLLD